ncbi:MAG: hypothetical protein AAGD25_12345, partial [Cyanobacteria bacterium P01_F01_bin.150]
ELTPQSDITVSSRFGTDGEFIIDLQGVDSTSDLGKLPSGVVDESDRVATGCPADSGANFIATGRGGVPADPTQSLVEDVFLHAFETLPSSYMGLERQPFADSRATSQDSNPALIGNPPLAPPESETGPSTSVRRSTSKIQNPKSKIQNSPLEAQSWQYDAQGQVQLWHPSVELGIETSTNYSLPHALASSFCQGGQNR